MQLISGLRERDYHVMRTAGPSTVFIPRVEPHDPLLSFFLNDLGCQGHQYKPEPLSAPKRTAWEIRLSTARIEVDETGLDPRSPTYSGDLAMRRARAIWEAAA